jgi:hypothetical protein
MNRLGYLLLAIILLVILAIAGAWYLLGSAPAAPSPAPVEEAPGADRTLMDSGTYYDIEAAYPSDTPIEDPAGEASALALMDAYVKAEAATFKKDNRVEDLTAEDAALLHLEDGRKYALGIEYETKTGPGTVTYIFSVYYDSLGAHPNAYMRTFTFDLATGAELTIADLFDDPKYLETLSEKSRAILIPQIAELSELEAEEVDRSMLDPGTEPKATNFQWFYLDAASLVLIFPPYQVGPWVIGTQEARIPKAELELKAGL